VVDSRDRDVSLHPLPSKYEVELEQDVFDLTSIQLVVADVPFAAYTVNEGNRRIPFFLLDSTGLATTLTPYVAVLTPGDYADPRLVTPTPGDDDLGAELAAAFNRAQNVGFSAAYSHRTDNYALSALILFTLAFGADPPTGAPPTGTAARLLGCAPGLDQAAVPNGAGGYVLQPPYRKNMELNRYLLLHVDTASLPVSINPATAKSFAVVPASQARMAFFADQASATVEKTYDPPLERLSRVGVSWTDYDGNPYDFQNQEHRIELVLKSRSGRKQDIDRGVLEPLGTLGTLGTTGRARGGVLPWNGPVLTRY
jgi:hypothetical protein